MPVFFKTPRKPAQAQFEPILINALAHNAIVDTTQCRTEAIRLLEQIPELAKQPTIAWLRVLAAFVLLVIVFVTATLLGKTQEYAKASETLLHCFELLFTATLGLLGIEAARHG